MPFLAISELVQPSARRAYFQYLERRQLSNWLELARAEALRSHRTFERMLSYQGLDEATDLWNVLHLFELAEGAVDSVASSVRERAAEASHLFGAGSIDPVRAETLMVTEGCSHSGGASNGADVLASIEYIHVPEEHREEYRESMVTDCGPSMRMMVASGVADSFDALETTEVHWSDESLPIWNQIHIVGVLAAMTPSRFERELDAALLRNDPTSGGCKTVFGRFAEYRDKPRWDFAREVTELSVVGGGRSADTRSDWS